MRRSYIAMWLYVVGIRDYCLLKVELELKLSGPNCKRDAVKGRRGGGGAF